MKVCSCIHRQKRNLNQFKFKLGPWSVNQNNGGVVAVVSSCIRMFALY